MSSLARTFSALSDPTRLNVVEALTQQGELPVAALLSNVEMSAPALSRHLKILREAGVIKQRAEGTKRYYRVAPEAMRAISDWTIQNRRFWDASLDRLDVLLAENGSGDDG